MIEFKKREIIEQHYFLHRAYTIVREVRNQQLVRLERGYLQTSSRPNVAKRFALFRINNKVITNENMEKNSHS